MTVENDRKIFAKGYPAIVPFLMEEYKGEVSFEVYSGVKKLCEAFQKEFAGRYFSEKALRFIGSAMDPYVEEHGYERDKKGAALYYNSYELRKGDRVNTDLILENSVLLTEALLGRVKNRTTFSLKELIDKELYAFVTVVEGEVVSIATVNERLGDTSVLEVTVETAVKARGAGYAKSNVAALAKYLCERGATVAYCCRNTHSKSNKIARSAGFEKVGRFYAVSAYRVR